MRTVTIKEQRIIKYQLTALCVLILRQTAQNAVDRLYVSDFFSLGDCFIICGIFKNFP